MRALRYMILLLLTTVLAACGTAGGQAYPNPPAGSAYPNPPAGSAYPNPPPASPPTTCAVTRQPDPVFVPPPPAPPKPPARYVGQFWYGTPDLWTMLGADGTWSGSEFKLFWWSQAYDVNVEPDPALTVSADRLDGASPAATVDKATNASADFGEAMLVGLTLPAAGCWQITGQYRGHSQSFVVWVTP